MLLLTLALFGCDGTQTVLYTSASLPGEPLGIALAADGNLVVSHEDEAGCCRLTGFLPSASTEVYERGAGPGLPMISDTRTYIVQPSGLAALDGEQVLWDLVLEGDSEGATAVTPSGIVLVGTWDGGVGRLYGISRLGEQEWVTSLGRIAGDIRVGADGTAYAATDDASGTLLHAVDGETGAVLWSEVGTARPVVALDGGLLVERNGLLARLDSDGLLEWTSDLEVGAGGATLTHDGYAWVPGPQLVAKVDVATGQVLQRLQRACGPLAYGQDNRMWGVCATGVEGQSALSAVSATVLPVSESFVGEGIGPPVLSQGSAFVLIGGTAPRLLGFSGASPASVTSPWSTATGVGNTGRPD